MESLIHIQIPKYPQWQKQTSKRRSWVALSTGFFDDPKVRAVLNDCPDALACFIWCLLHADADGIVTVREDILRLEWRKVTGVQSNAFSTQKRLNTLCSVGLLTTIEPQSGGNRDSFEGQSNPNRDQIEHDSEVNREAETQAHSDDVAQKNVPTYIQTDSTNKAEFHSDGVNPSQVLSDSVPAQNTVSDPVWGDGLILLTSKGTSESQARSFLGALVKTHGRDAVTDAIAKAIIEDPAEPKAYLKGILQRAGNKPNTPSKPLTREDLEIQAACERRAKRMEALAQNGR